MTSAGHRVVLGVFGLNGGCEKFRAWQAVKLQAWRADSQP